MKEFEMTGRVGRDLRPDDVRIVAARELNLRGNAVINVIDPTKSYQPTFPNPDATCVSKEVALFLKMRACLYSTASSADWAGRMQPSSPRSTATSA